MGPAFRSCANANDLDVKACRTRLARDQREEPTREWKGFDDPCWDQDQRVGRESKAGSGVPVDGSVGVSVGVSVGTAEVMVGVVDTASVAGSRVAVYFTA